MQFRLTYRGELRSGNTKNRSHIHSVRTEFHRQLVRLWEQPPLSEHTKWLRSASDAGPGNYFMLYDVGGRTFASVAGPGTETLAELAILFLRPALPGALVRHGGDIDNRIKTLLDCLRIPSVDELPPDWQTGRDEAPFHCLLQDDKLVTSFSVTSDRLLDYKDAEHEVLIVVHVKLTAVRVTMGNVGLIG